MEVQVLDIQNKKRNMNKRSRFSLDTIHHVHSYQVKIH